MANIKTIPAFVDMHVHLREPGFERKETIETGMAAALQGGYEIICAMPNTHPCADNPDVIRLIKEKASYNPLVTVLPIGAVTKKLTTKELAPISELKEAGAIAFSNDGYPILDKITLKKALMTGELILSHLEEEEKEVIWQIDVFKEVKYLSGRGLSKPPKLHFCHISTKNALEAIRKAKQQGFEVTCETAPHYFTFTKNDVTSNGVFKMNPPLRENTDKEAVIEALKDGTIDVIATDHAPHTEHEKLLAHSASPNGITGLETAFSLALNVLSVDEIVEKMSVAPAKILGVKTKRTIKVDLDKKWVVKAKKFKSKCKVSPYENMELKGKVYVD